MTKIQITPWKYHSQLLSVRDRFYPPASYGGEDLREKACSLVWVWKHRGNLPHAVEATALLTDAILHDDPSQNSTFSIRATYSLAFCRFVTGLVDSKLHGPKLSMYQKAMMLGVPASFVELRHEATHRDLPSLVVLRNAAERSLNWLWEFYWAKLDHDQYDLDWSKEEKTNDEAEEGERDVEGLKKDVWNILQPVAREKRSQLKTAASLKKGGKKKQKQKAGLRSERAVAEESYCLKGVISLCCRESLGGLAVVQVLLDRDEEVMVPRIEVYEKVLDMHFASWNEFLKQICQACKPFLTSLVEEMARILVDPPSPDSPTTADDEPYLQNLVRWMDHILTSETWANFRNRYLILSHVEILCAEAVNSNNIWADRLQEVLKRHSPPSEDAGRMPAITNNGASHVDEKDNDIEMKDREDSRSDVAVLRDIGWDFSERPNLKAIGVV